MVLVHDFHRQATWARPYHHGVYDLTANQGMGERGHRPRHNTVPRPRPFTAGGRRWDLNAIIAGRRTPPVTADGGGSNASRSRLWKVALQGRRRESSADADSCIMLRQATNKWNKIEQPHVHRITQILARPALVSPDVILNLIANTTTATED